MLNYVLWVVVVAKLSYLEIDTFQPLLVKFISKTVKDRRNPPIYYRKLSTQSIQQQQKKHFKIG